MAVAATVNNNASGNLLTVLNRPFNKNSIEGSFMVFVLQLAITGVDGE
jgi:hypothetical protein